MAWLQKIVEHAEFEAKLAEAEIVSRDAKIALLSRRLSAVRKVTRNPKLEKLCIRDLYSITPS